MNVLFIQRQFNAPPAVITLSGTEKINDTIEEWWGVYFRGEKIGYATQTISPRANGYTLSDRSVLNLNLLGTVQPTTTRLEMEANDEWILEKFDFELRSRDVHFQARGAVSGARLSLEINSGGHESRRDLTLTQAPYLLAALKPYVVTQQLETGKELMFSTFDPSTLSQQVTTVVIEGRERIPIDGRIEPAIRLRQSFRGISIVSWVDGHGRTLKEESPAGLSLVRQTAQEARALPGQAMKLDLVAETAIPVAAPLDDLRKRNSIGFKLAGVDLASFSLHGGRQRLIENRLEVRLEDPAQLDVPKIPVREARLASYLQPTAFLQSDHPTIRQLAAKIVGGETDGYRAAIKIKDWVHGEIAKAPTVSIPNALEVLRTRRGDCNEHTVLFNALARAAGLPAKTVVGVVHARGAFYYHAWSEVWLGEWVSLDAVLNQFPADVSHIKFLEGEIDRQIDLLQLIGNLSIEVIDS